MDNWLTTVGVEEFGIKHYWMRFEFAKGRGTIHSHILAITKDAHMTKTFNDAFQKGKTQATRMIAEYARETLALTAEKTKLRKGAPPTRINPLTIPYCQITSDEHDKHDTEDIVHNHECNKFCLRYPRNG